MKEYEDVSRELKELRWFYKDYKHLKEYPDKVKLAEQYNHALAFSDCTLISIYNYYIVEGFSQKEICCLLGISQSLFTEVYNLLKEYLCVHL